MYFVIVITFQHQILQTIATIMSHQPPFHVNDHSHHKLNTSSIKRICLWINFSSFLSVMYSQFLIVPEGSNHHPLIIIVTCIHATHTITHTYCFHTTHSFVWTAIIFRAVVKAVLNDKTSITFKSIAANFFLKALHLSLHPYQPSRCVSGILHAGVL